MCVGKNLAGTLRTDNGGEYLSNVVCFSSIRVLLAFAEENDMMVHQMDVVTAFLNGRDLYEAIRSLCHTWQRAHGMQAKEITLRVKTVSSMLEQSIS